MWLAGRLSGAGGAQAIPLGSPGHRYGQNMAGEWPLAVGAHDLVPVQLDSTHTVHLTDRAGPGDSVTRRAGEFRHSAPLPRGPGGGLYPGTPAWRASTLCGRAWTSTVIQTDLDLLGEHRGRLCQSCWRTVEGWLSPPPPAGGEDGVVHWVVETVLEVGEAMVEGVPIPRIESLRRRVRSEIKAAVGGSVKTSKLGPATLWVSSGLVNGAKTPERWQQELHAAMQRLWASEDGQEIEPPKWRRHWSEIAEADS